MEKPFLCFFFQRERKTSDPKTSRKRLISFRIRLWEWKSWKSKIHFRGARREGWGRRKDLDRTEKEREIELEMREINHWLLNNFIHKIWNISNNSRHPIYPSIPCSRSSVAIDFSYIETIFSCNFCKILQADLESRNRADSWYLQHSSIHTLSAILHYSYTSQIQFAVGKKGEREKKVAE